MEELNPNKQLTQDMSSSRPKSIRKKLAWFVGIILAIDDCRNRLFLLFVMAGEQFAQRLMQFAGAASAHALSVVIAN